MRLISILFFLCFSWEAVAQEQTKWDVIVNHPSVVSKKMNDNGEVIEVTFSGPVIYSKEGDAILSIDNSDFGAVWCNWEMYNAIVQITDKCFQGVSEFKEDINNVETRLDEFIIRNSLFPVTQKELSERRLDVLKKMESDAVCETDTAKWAEEMFSKLFENKMALKEGVEKLLSIDRPPVTNPCF